MNTPPEDETILSFQRFIAIKTALIKGNELAIATSWEHLLGQLRQEVQKVSDKGLSVFPIINYDDLSSPGKTLTFLADLRTRGSAIIRNVVPKDEAETWTSELDQYLQHNSHATVSQSDNVELHGLFWSPAQIKARAHPNMLAVQKFLMGQSWKTGDHYNQNSRVSVDHPLTYADRIRVVTQDGSCEFSPSTLNSVRSARVDGGGIERWDSDGYGGRMKGGTYEKIWSGNMEAYDPWDSSTRLDITTNLYDCESACTSFRMFQGLLALDSTSHPQMEICALPLKLATSYWLLRPFFSPKSPVGGKTDAFLSSANWVLNTNQNPDLHGAQPGHFQEINTILHPHLQLDKTLVPLPQLNAGDLVVWHPDTIYAQTKTSHPSACSSCSSSPTALSETITKLLDMPICPLTLTNAHFLYSQRKAFILGLPGPDYNNAPHLCDNDVGISGEGTYLGRPGVQEVYNAGGEAALRAMGLLAWDVDKMTIHEEAERRLIKMANDVLFPDQI
ncbi:hypothetical protein BD289DRAFT_370015 [Coniella lustricola]|uniref:DUF1479 domain protein n=1 Tax=Coniella lustricola TaxID=2025994 RepID=A0A2T3A5W7_9PEZI|nr:hypothetical protein BD289DRAFT_370015 [Coniella lustricola]